MDIMDAQHENPLEQSLRLAADEPAHRPDFFKTLLNSTVYVLGTAGTDEGHGQEPAQRTVEKDTNVLLGQPSQYPSRMVNSLTQLLAKHRNVKRAFLALMHDPSVDQKPHLIIGIEADGDFERVMREAGNVAGDTPPPDGKPVDLYRVQEGGTGLSEEVGGLAAVSAWFWQSVTEIKSGRRKVFATRREIRASSPNRIWRAVVSNHQNSQAHSCF
jgi:hypothetical protein